MSTRSQRRRDPERTLRRPGTAGQTTELIPFRAGDGTWLTLLHVTRADADRRQGNPTRGPVLLVHGAGVRAEIFRPPLPRTLVDALLDDGFDVWLLNWRASIDLRPVAWTLDEAAAYDYPAAVRLDAGAQPGRTELKAFVHCQGSTSLMMAAISGLLPEVQHHRDQRGVAAPGRAGLVTGEAAGASSPLPSAS